MKKVMIIAVVCALMVSSCGTHTGSGAYAGAQLGSILGTAIGGISGGYRGSSVGTVVGMVGGAVVGAAVGSAADKREKQEVHEHYQRVQERKAQERRYSTRQNNDDVYRGNNDSGFDSTMSGDDRLYGF